MKCKVFKEDANDLEDEVNDWLKSEDIEIMHTNQTMDDDYVVLTIFYLTEKELRKKKLNKLKDYDTED